MQRYLVIFDLNGTLLQRLKKKDGALKNRSAVSLYSFSCNGSKVYIRPHLKRLIDDLFLLDNVDVAVWTSAQRSNADTLVKNIFGDHLSKLKFVWARDKCTDAPMGVKTDTVKKPLKKVWDACDGIWNDRNTVLVDDSILKAVETPRNIYHIKKFDLLIDEDPLLDIELLNLRLWIKKIMAKSDDVRLLIDQRI